MQIKEAIILAGGLGTRLRPSVPDLPKCLAPVAGRPFLSYIIDYLIQQGVAKFIFALGYKHELFENFIERSLVRSAQQSLGYLLSIETEPLGTGGAIQLACGKSTEETVLIVNGDTYFRINLGLLYGVHQEWEADCTLSLKPMRNFDRFGSVELNPDHSIMKFQEKMYYEKGLINGGVYALGVKKFLESGLPEAFSFEKDYLQKQENGRRIFGHVQDAYFIDIGIPEDYDRAQTEMQDFENEIRENQ